MLWFEPRLASNIIENAFIEVRQFMGRIFKTVGFDKQTDSFTSEL